MSKLGAAALVKRDFEGVPVGPARVPAGKPGMPGSGLSEEAFPLPITHRGSGVTVMLSNEREGERLFDAAADGVLSSPFKPGWGVDWLSVRCDGWTQEPAKAAVEKMLLRGGLIGKWEEGKQRETGYSRGTTHSLGAVVSDLPYGALQGSMLANIRLPGQVVSVLSFGVLQDFLRACGVPWPGNVRIGKQERIFEGPGPCMAHVSRIDIRFDQRAVTARVANEAWDAGRLKAGVLQARFQDGKGEEGMDGLRIGKRSSDFYLRIYDKSVKDGGGFAFTRIEGEYKRGMAEILGREFAAAADLEAFVRVVQGDWAARVRCGDGWWQGVIAGYIGERLSVPKKVRTLGQQRAWMVRCHGRLFTQFGRAYGDKWWQPADAGVLGGLAIAGAGHDE